MAPHDLTDCICDSELERQEWSRFLADASTVLRMERRLESELPELLQRPFDVQQQQRVADLLTSPEIAQANSARTRLMEGAA